MRRYIDLIESHLDQDHKPEIGAGEPCTRKTVPKVLYHGTNVIAGAAIVKSGRIRADDPVDDDDLGAVVCTTSKQAMARNFAVEFARVNSSLGVGVVFAIDGKKALQAGEIIPYHAETASAFEYEYRVQGDITRDMIIGVKMVGETGRLKSYRFLEELWDNRDFWHITRNFNSLGEFVAVINTLIEASR